MVIITLDIAGHRISDTDCTWKISVCKSFRDFAKRLERRKIVTSFHSTLWTLCVLARFFS